MLNRLLSRIVPNRPLQLCASAARLAAVITLLSPVVFGTPADTARAATVTDLAGRTVTVPDQINRILLGEGRYLPAIAMLDRDDPLKRVVGTMGDFPLLDPGGYEQWTARLPGLKDIPLVGKASADSFSAETAIALAPDVAIFGLAGHGPGPDAVVLIQQLEAAGIPVVFVDFFLDPLVNTPKSVSLLGTLLQRPADAEAFVSAYSAALADVDRRLATVTKRPSVFLEVRVGLSDDCCWSVGDGVIGRLIDRAGGRNLASGKVPGNSGLVSLEYLLSTQPDIYIATAIGNSVVPSGKRIVMGPGVTEENARTSFGNSLKRTGIADLAAVRSGNAHTIWHHFFHSPFNVVAVQAMAKWFHPEAFADLDPLQTYKDFSDRFQPVPVQGVYWVDQP